jgi:peptidyl-prolyl cis-trans isomerase C
MLIAVGGPACRRGTPSAPDGNSTDATVPDESATADATPPGDAEAPAAAQTVVATVNGHDISQAALDQRVNQLSRQVAGKLQNLPEPLVAQVQKKIQSEALNALITEQLLWEQVQASGVEVSDAEILAEIERIAAERQPPMTAEQFKSIVESQGGDFEDVKSQFRRGLSYRKFMEKQWAGKLDVTDEEAREYFEEHSEQYDEAEQVRARHILIKPAASDPNADPNEAKVAAREKAEKLRAEIESGADFAALAKEHSSCPSAAQGGDLKFFARGAMVPPFEKAAFALEPGDVSDVVETRFGYHIIKVTDRKAAQAATFDETKDAIVDEIKEAKRSTISKEYLESLRAEAVIEYPETDQTDADQAGPAGAAAEG